LQAKDYKFYAIGDRFRSLEEVSDGLREAGLESSQLVRTVDGMFALRKHLG
jgi:hypothetical protein